MTRGLIFFLTLLPIFHAPAQDSALPFSTFFSSIDYYGGIQNYAITQDPSGVVYVANNYGVLEYDGSTWRRNSLPSGAKVRHVLLDKDGILYVAGQGDLGYFYSDDLGRIQFQSLKSELPEAYRDLEEVWKVYISQDQVYFCTSLAIFVFDSQGQFLRLFSSRSTFESFHFNGRKVIVNEVGSGLQEVHETDLLPMPGGRLFHDKQVTGLLQVTESSHLVFTRDSGGFFLNGESAQKWGPLVSSQINTVLRLKSGKIAIGTQADGLFVCEEEGEQLLRMGANTGLNDDAVLSLFEDLSGNLWVGHANGISLVELSSPFRKVNRFVGLVGTGYHAAMHGGDRYYGTNNGVYVQKGKAKATLLPNTSGQVYQIKSMHGRLLVAHNDGALILDGDIARPIGGPAGVWNFQPLLSHPNHMIVGGYNGIYLYEFEGNIPRFVRQLSGFSESSRVIEQDDSGAIWVAHGYKGIYRLRLDQNLESVSVEAFGPESGLPTLILNNVWKIDNRLVFTTQAGVFVFDHHSGQFVRDAFFAAYFSESDVIHYLQEAPLGSIFFVAETEMGVLERRVDGTFVKHSKVFNRLLPLLNDDLQNIASMRANEVLFAANEGFVHFNLNDNTYRPHSYPTLIRAVYLTGQFDSLIYGGASKIPSHSTPQPVRLAYNQANLRIETSNPTPNHQSEFQFWLEGLEEGYGEWVPKRDRAYTNLREGEYTFHVRSRNQFGEPASEASWTFVVLPPWYRSSLAYGMYGISILLIGFVAYRTIDKRYQRKTQRLKIASKKVIEEKESALQISLREVEKLRMERLRQEIQVKDKELAAATMHLITKNGFIDQVKGNLTGIIKKSRNQEVKNEIQKVIKNIEKNIADDEAWEQFEIHFDQVHGDFMSRFKKSYPGLSPQEIKLSAYLRMNLSTKEIAYLMNISVRGVEIARYRLRKKLELQREENLQEFILKY